MRGDVNNRKKERKSSAITNFNLFDKHIKKDTIYF